MAFPRAGHAIAPVLAGSMTVLTAATAFAAEQPQRTFSTGFVNRHSNLCLSVDGARTENGVRMLQWECGPQDNQQWILTPADPANTAYYQIRSAESGRCLSVSNAGTANGVPLLQWDCGTRDNQQWKLVQKDGGFFAVVGRGSHKCLSIPGGSAQNGAAAIQWDCHSGQEQRWRLG
jgi:hypothetical protein